MDEQRPQRQGYSDLERRQEEGVPALEADEAREAADRSQRADSAEGETNREAGELAPEGNIGGADAGGRRSGGDGGMTTPTGG